MQVFKQAVAAHRAGQELRKQFLIRWMCDRALQQPLNCGRHLRTEKCADFLLMLAAEADHFVEHRRRRTPGTAAEHSP